VFNTSENDRGNDVPDLNEQPHDVEHGWKGAERKLSSKNFLLCEPGTVGLVTTLQDCGRNARETLCGGKTASKQCPPGFTRLRFVNLDVNDKILAWLPQKDLVHNKKVVLKLHLVGKGKFSKVNF
jgi:hypothetical protein